MINLILENIRLNRKTISFQIIGNRTMIPTITNKMMRIVDISLFKPVSNGLNFNNPNTNNIANLLSEEIFKFKFNPTTEFISKPYNIYSLKRINKIFFLSNLYKIFMTNIPTTIPFSTFDFFRFPHQIRPFCIG